MKLLLDTHALIWWFAGDDALSSPARAAIADERNAILVSAASAMEVATKFRLGKLPQAAVLARSFGEMLAHQGFTELSISVRHAQLAGSLDIPHKDPFDRFLIAQAQADGLHLVSNEALFDDYGVNRLW
jgi:PIN domain nuclease of toxin-antitoxin system